MLLYIDDIAAPVTPDPSVLSNWTFLTGTQYRALSLGTGGSSLVTGGTVGPFDPLVDSAAIVVAVSPPLAAQTLSPGGAWVYAAQMRMQEGDITDECMPFFELLVMSNDGSTLVASLGLTFGNSIEFSATGLKNACFAFNQFFPEQAVSAGDRLVAVFGCISNVGTTPEAFGRYGAPSATSNLPANDDTSTNDYLPWVDLGGSPTFQGGTTYNVTPSDTVSVSDATVCTASYGTVLSDALSVSDQVSAGFLIEVSISETAIDVSDSTYIAAERSVSDSAVVVDQLGIVTNYVRSESDALSVSDQVSVGFSIAVPIDETSIEVSDSTYITIEPAVSDSAGIADLLETAASYVRDVSDTVSIPDTAVAGFMHDRSVSDVISDIADLTVRHPTFSRPLADVLIVEDLVRLADAQVVLADVVTTGDLLQLQVVSSFHRTADDVLGVADQLEVLVITFQPRLQDDVSVWDITIVQMTYRHPFAVCADSIDEPVDSVAAGLQLVFEAAISDAVAVSDSIGSGLEFLVTVEDDIDATDSIARETVSHARITDAIATPDFTSASIPVYADRNPFNRAPGVL